MLGRKLRLTETANETKGGQNLSLWISTKLPQNSRPDLDSGPAIQHAKARTTRCAVCHVGDGVREGTRTLGVATVNGLAANKRAAAA